jgi:hypothetical protein
MIELLMAFQAIAARGDARGLPGEGVSEGVSE